MTADKMATQAIAEAQGGLEVDGPTSLCLGSQGGSFEGFLADISAKSVSAEFRHGEADPIDGVEASPGSTPALSGAVFGSNMIEISRYFGS